MSSLLSGTSHLFVNYCETLRDMNDAVFLFEVHDCLKLGNREQRLIIKVVVVLISKPTKCVSKD